MRRLLLLVALVVTMADCVIVLAVEPRFLRLCGCKSKLACSLGLC